VPENGGRPGFPRDQPVCPKAGRVGQHEEPGRNMPGEWRVSPAPLGVPRHSLANRAWKPASSATCRRAGEASLTRNATPASLAARRARTKAATPAASTNVKPRASTTTNAARAPRASSTHSRNDAELCWSRLPSKVTSPWCGRALSRYLGTRCTWALRPPPTDSSARARSAAAAAPHRDRWIRREGYANSLGVTAGEWRGD
jgi:hypothetical protein